MGGASEVVYQTATLAAEVGQARVLLVDQGKPARKMAQQLTELGLEVCVPVTADKKLDAPVKHAATQVMLGERYTPQLMANSFAVLHAAKKCRAFVVLLGEDALPLARVDEFLARAQREGMLVFRAVAQGPHLLGWALCETRADVPANETWVTCPHCDLTFSRASVQKNLHACPQCEGYFRMPSAARITLLADEGSFVEWDERSASSDPLEFPGYAEKLGALREKTSLDEAVRTGSCSIAGRACALGVMDTGFLMGSMGHVVGEKLSRMIDRAAEEGMPVVIVCASGGARMQEGLVSLMQMAKVSCALERHGRAGLPYIAVLTDPTTGGVTASFAMQADIILAEPRALIGFAGQRVIRDTIRQNLPEGFQTAEFALEHGLIDAVVPRRFLRTRLAHLLALHAPRVDADTDLSMFALAQKEPEEDASVRAEHRNESGPFPFSLFRKRTGGEKRSLGEMWVRGGKGQCVTSIFATAPATTPATTPAADRKVRKVLESHALDAAGECAASARKQGAFPAEPCERAAWESVQLARNTHRPTALHYIEHAVDGFVELHGDRAFGDDAAVVGGIGWIDGRPVTIIAQEKGRTLEERIRRNFGCAQPEGYRKALRLMRQAEKFGRPVVCLVDTQGAFCGTQAEERGQGNALADNLLALAGLRVPVVSVLLGEGGSGGALALALANRVAMQRHAVYSVLSPEGFASILWKDRSRAAEAASVMRMDAASVHAMGIVEEVLSEGAGAAHENPEEAAGEVRAYLVRALSELSALDPEELVRQRHERFARF